MIETPHPKGRDAAPISSGLPMPQRRCRQPSPDGLQKPFHPARAAARRQTKSTVVLDFTETVWETINYAVELCPASDGGLVGRELAS